MFSLNQNLKVGLFITIGCVLNSGFAYADEGHETSGGGDTKTEGRINDIRVDILKWINEGGAKTLKFEDGMTYELYVPAMNQVLTKQAVVISAITTKEEKSDDNELNTTVAGQPKTCKGFISKKDSLPHILCNVERFAETSESDQYRLVHHEYAGLAQVEKNVGAASDYSISTQITDSLVPTTILRLAVKSKQVVNEKTKHICRTLVPNDGPFAMAFKPWLDVSTDYEDALTYCADVETLENGEYTLTNITVKPEGHSTSTLEANRKLARFICKYLVSGKNTLFTKSSTVSGANWEGAVTARTSAPKPVNNGYYTKKQDDIIILTQIESPAFETLSCKR